MKRTQRGFTLIELLIVVAILGILGAILFVAIGTSPQVSARDARRIADVNQLQLALELYKNADSQGAYPTSLAALAPTYIGGEPKDPKTGLKYNYSFNPLTNPTNYHLGVTLEDSSNKALCTDADFDDSAFAGGTKFPGGGNDPTLNCANGTIVNGDAKPAIYDVKS